MRPEVRKMANLYRDRLEIPKIKPKTQFYVIPVGLVGSGKTPVLKKLSKILHLVRISGDEIRKTIIDNKGHIEDTGEVATLLADELSAEGYSIAHDTDGASPNTQKIIKELVDRYGVKVFWIHINPPEEFILEKIGDYKHAWDTVGARDRYFERKPLHDNLPMDFIDKIDTSKNNLDDQIRKTAEIITKNL